MSDYIDLSQQEQQEFINESLNKHRATKHTRERVIQPEGYCHTCYEDVQGQKLFCDSHCAKMYR